MAAGGVGHVEAVALLVDRARAVDAGFRVGFAANAEVDQPAVSVRLDGIPLALELAAARSAECCRSVQPGGRDGSADRFGLLSTGRLAPPHCRATRPFAERVIDWSHELCSPAGAGAVGPAVGVRSRRGRPRGGASRCAASPGWARPCEPLAGLADKSVVTVSENDGRVRFRMLETIREYGAEMLAEGGETELMRDRHRDHYLASARKAQEEWFGPDQLDLLARTTTDLGNLRAAFDRTLSLPDDRTAALELASAVSWYWEPAGALDEGARWFARALGDEQADAADASPTRLRTLADAVHLCAVRNDADAALPLGRRAAALPTPEPTAADRAARHLAQAHLATVTGNHDGALASDHQALREFRAAGNLLKQVEVLQGIATITDVLGRPTEAAAALEQAIRLCDSRGERFERRAAMQYYGFVHLGLGRYEQAFSALRASLTAWPVLRPNNVAQALWAIAKTHAALDHGGPAAVLLGARVRIRDDFGYALSPYTNESFEAFERRLSGAIGRQTFLTAFDAGYAMPLESAVRFALGEEEIPARRPAPAAGVSQLSKRLQQVAELMARGQSNKEIAAELIDLPSARPRVTWPRSWTSSERTRESRSPPSSPAERLLRSSPRACAACRPPPARDLVVGELEIEGRDGVVEVVRLGRADDGRGDDGVVQHPGQRDLRHRDAARLGDLLTASTIGGLRRRVGSDGSSRGGGLLPPRPGQPALGQRAPRDAADALVGEQAEHLPLLLALHEAVLVLHRHEPGPAVQAAAYCILENCQAHIDDAPR